jgi:hypothetical protein
VRARFNPHDGHLYVVGMNGWQTAAQRDGSLQRVRYTGKAPTVPIELSVHEGGIRLRFAHALDKKIAEDVTRYRIEQWNYRWSADYGSKRWSVANPLNAGQDRVPITFAKMLPDGRGVFLEIKGLRPVMQMQINYGLASAGGAPLEGVVYNTIHRLGAE